jgi:hypothetical protein
MDNQNLENRKHKRYKASLDVDAVIGDKIVQSTTRDICSNGVFIYTQIKVQAGEDACVVFTLPMDNEIKPVKLYGKSVRTDPKGVAVQFEGRSPFFMEILERSIQGIPDSFK